MFAVRSKEVILGESTSRFHKHGVANIQKGGAGINGTNGGTEQKRDSEGKNGNMMKKTRKLCERNWNLKVSNGNVNLKYLTGDNIKQQSERELVCDLFVLSCSHAPNILKIASAFDPEGHRQFLEQGHNFRVHLLAVFPVQSITLSKSKQ